MTKSSNGNIFRLTGPLCRKINGHRWIPLTRASDAYLWYFLWYAPEQTVEQTIETSVICDAITLMYMGRTLPIDDPVPAGPILTRQLPMFTCMKQSWQLMISISILDWKTLFKMSDDILRNLAALCMLILKILPVLTALLIHGLKCGKVPSRRECSIDWKMRRQTS